MARTTAQRRTIRLAGCAWAACILVLAGCSDAESGSSSDAASDLAPDAPADSTAPSDSGTPTDSAPTDTAPPDTGPPPDTDTDGVIDVIDNCPDAYNPTQVDADQDGVGDTCDPDVDGDGVPNDADMWPFDGDRPGVAADNTVYAHTSGALYVLGVKTYQVQFIGDFTGLGDGEMTDIAIDRYGVLYGITFDDLFTCHPQTAACTLLGALPGSFNGLTWVPAGLIDPTEDVLVGIAGDGGWWRLDVDGGLVSGAKLGEYGGAYTSSGDAFSIEDVGTYASVNKTGESSDLIIRLDPTTGTFTGEVVDLGSYTAVWGLAGWTARVFGFDESGAVFVVDLTNGDVDLIVQTGQAWWGAGVKTRL